MPIAQLPDGTQLDFPDGIDPAVMQRAVKQHLATTKMGPTTGAPDGTLNGIPLDAPRAAAPPQASHDPGTLERMAIGANAVVRDPVLAIGQLLGDENQSVVDKQRALEASGGATTTLTKAAGEIAGPAGGLVAGGARLLGRVLPRALGGAGGLAAQSGAAALGDPLLNPRAEGETVAGNMGSAALGTAAIGGAFKGAGAVAGGFKPNADWQTLRAEGITPGLAQSTDSAIGKGVGHTLDFLSGPMGEHRVARGGLVRSVERATPYTGPTAPVTVAPGKDVNTRDLMANLQARQQQAYSDIFAGHTGQFDSQLGTDANRTLTNAGLTPTERRRADAAIKAQFGDINGPVVLGDFNSGRYGDFRKMVQQYQSSQNVEEKRTGDALAGVVDDIKAWRGRELAASVQSKGGTPEDAQALVDRLTHTDSTYGDYRRLMAATAGEQNSKVAVPRMLDKAVQAAASQSAYGTGAARGQDLTDALVRASEKPKAVGNNWMGNSGRAGLGYAAYLTPGGLPALTAAVGTSALLNTERGTRMLMGDLRGQQTLADLLRRGGDNAARLYEGTQ